MNKTKNLAFIVSLSIVCSCSSMTGDLNQSFSIKSIPESSPSITSNLKTEDIGLPKNDKKDSIKANIVNSKDRPKKPRFDFIPPEGVDTVSDKIVVIYKENYKVRIDKKNKKIISNSNISEIESLLNDKITSMQDLDIENKGEDYYDKIQKKASEYHETEIPNLKSIHYYQIPQSVNVKQLCKELRKLPQILTVYPAVKTKMASAQLLNRSYPGVYENSQKPTEPWFTYAANIQGKGRYEYPDWWWYNPERIFDGWKVYKQSMGLSLSENIPISNLPRIAIIDRGFDLSSNFPDKINYVSNGIKFYAWKDYTTNPVSTKLGAGFGAEEHKYDGEWHSDMDNRNFSHGTAIASVAAAPVNNYQGLAGIAPNASIYPIKLEENLTTFNVYTDDFYVVAINHAIQPEQNIDVINISSILEGSNPFPLNYSPAISSIIATATGLGKSVVLAAGNDKLSLPSSIVITSGGILYPIDNGEIIVGGTMLDMSSRVGYPATGFPVAWQDFDSNLGSNYGDVVDISAGAKDIYAYSSDPSNETSNNQSTMPKSVFRLKGTSFAAPQVSATIGMMKKLAEHKGLSNFANSPRWLRDILTFSANFHRYTENAVVSYPFNETKKLGRGLENNILNDGGLIGVRGLNMVNAFTMINNYNSYNALVRVSNIDDEAWFAKNYDWANRLNYMGTSDPYYNTYGNLEFVKDQYRRDAIWGVNNLSGGDSITFTTYNQGYTRLTYGYQMFYRKNNPNYWEYCEALAGVAGVVGANNNNYYSTGYYGDRWCQYNP